MRSITVSVMFCLTSMPRINPWPLRSSGTQPMPCFTASAGVVDRHLVPIDQYRAAGFTIRAAEQADRLGATGADQAGQPDNLTFADAEADILNTIVARKDGAPPARHP